MVSTQKVKVSGFALNILFGLLLSLGVTVLMTACSAYLISGETIPEGSISLCAVIIHAISAAAGAWLSSAKNKGKRMQICLLSGLCYLLVLLSMTALFFGGEYEGFASSALAVFLGCGSVGIIGAMTKKKGKFKHRKTAYR